MSSTYSISLDCTMHGTVPRFRVAPLYSQLRAPTNRIGARAGLPTRRGRVQTPKCTNDGVTYKGSNLGSRVSSHGPSPLQSSLVSEESRTHAGPSGR